MDTNRVNMQELFRSYNTSFTEGMQRGIAIPAEMKAEYMTLADLVMTVMSTGAEEVHAYLNQMPGFRRWIGDRIKKNISSGKLHVINSDWEDTVTVERNDILDDKYGLYTPMFTNLGAEGSDDALWLDMAIDALLANGQWADGKAFFATDRTYGNNNIVNKTTAELSAAALETAIATMMSYVGPENNTLRVIPIYLLVGPSRRDLAWDMVKNSLVSSGTGKGGAIENRVKGRALLRVHPKITGNQWYLLGMKGAMKPIGVQRRQEPVLVAKDRPTDDNVFDQKQFVYGADARGEAFLTLPHLAYAGIPA